MKTAIHCIVLLACVVICTSASIKRCRCVKATRVYLKKISAVKVYEPRSYCSRKEVIVTLKDNRELCLDPKKLSTVQRFLKRQQMLKAKRAAKMNTTLQTTTASSTVIATATATATLTPP